MTPEEVKMVKKLRAQELVRRPFVLASRTCWALVKRPSNNSGFGRAFGNYSNCENRPRLGHRTCARHAGREQDAQNLGE